MRFFNKTLAFVACCLLLPFTSTQAQVSAYLFTQTSGTYTPITGGTVLGTTTSDDQRFVDVATPAGGTTLTGVGLPIGFNFSFDGVIYDRFAINNNGWISLGQSALTPAVNINSSSNYTGISATSTAPADLQRRVAALAQDLQGQTGSTLRFQTIGTTPNQVLVIQWSNYRSYLATGENLNFQIRLYETSNRIETVYGTFVGSTANTAQVGLRGTANTDFNNRSAASGTNTWATSAAGGTNTATVGFSSTFAPTSGQIYRWDYSTCPPPASFAVAGITTVTANFSWTTNIAAGAGQLVIVPQGAAPTTGTIIPVSGTTYNATGLTPSSSYTAYLRRICAPGDTSNWANVSFNTLCANVALPWTESFENVAVATTAVLFPNCWAINTSGFSTGNGAQTNNRSARTGSKYLFTNWSTTAGTGDWAFTPGFTLTAGRQYDFSFWYKADGATGFDSLRVGVGSTQTPAGMTIIGTPVYNITNTTYQQYFVSYTPTVTGTYYFGTNVWAGFVPWYINFDDYNLIETPTCPQPSAIVVSPVSASSATISWTSNAPGNSWYVYATTATTLGTNMGTLTTSNPHVLTGLTPNTSYNFFVREYCTVADTSYWSGPFNFLTDCAPSTQGDSMQTAYNVTSTSYSQANSTARCYTNTTGNASPDVWYRVILDPCATQLTASLCVGTTFDSYIRVYDATGTNQLAFNDDGCGSQSIVSNLDVRAHDTVYVVVEGWTGGVSGSYNISITQAAPIPTADITFSAPSYCVNGANPTPTILATTGGVFSSNPSSLGLDPVNGQLSMNTATGGATYQVIYSVGQPGCLSVDSFMITATAADNAGFAYATNNALCETNTAATPSITGLAGGMFSTTSTTLSLNTSTGAINAGTSGLGMHNVVYATTGTCPNTQTVMVRIDTTEDASFDYAQVSVCKSSAAISPAITGLMGGMFMSGTGLVMDAQTGIIDVAASTAGAYTVTYTMPNACASNSTDAIQIVALDNPAFSYNRATYCQNASHPLPVVTGLAGGTFSSGTGLPVDIGTGLIDLANAITNTPHTVIYVTDGACINFSIVTVTVIPADDASFAYSANSYCVLGSTPNQTPTISGNAGGTFTASGNLPINASTGAITVSTASTGTYTIRYVTNGPTTCRDTAFATIILQNCPALSVNEPLNTNAAYTLYPNPNNGQFAIVLSEGEEMVQLSVSDALGRTVYSQENVNMVANAPVQIQLNSLSAGTYYVRLSNSNSTKTIPVVIMQP